MSMKKISYVNDNGELVTKEFDDLFNALQFVIFHRIQGSKIQTNNEWQDTDKLIEGFKKMFAPA
jgi:hypothetical protein